MTGCKEGGRAFDILCHGLQGDVGFELSGEADHQLRQDEVPVLDGAGLQLTLREGGMMPAVVADPSGLRAGIAVKGLKPGRYVWQLGFGAVK